ncbi:MAG: methyltransferase domain-containing protein [Gammaproteobacteria bacterium]|jgi:malonyl-CoA O-methyltransferase|nr:methyltransferase domain-containing protein [Gammaproteobacteria bacterium]
MTLKDIRYLRRAFDRNADDFNENDFLHCEVRSRILERLPLFKIQPNTILDLGGGTGELGKELQKNFFNAQVISLDSSVNMATLAEENVDSICAEVRQLPFAENSIDMIVSNFALHYCADEEIKLRTTLKEINRVLRPGGLLLFTLPGRDSLFELRESFSAKFEHIDQLPDLHNLGDEMLAAGLVDPVLDSEVLTITYEKFDQLIRELRAVSSTRSVSKRRHSLGGKADWKTARQNYEKLRNTDNKLPATIELVYAHAWGGQPPQGHYGDEGEYSVPLSRLLKRGPRKMDTD